MALVTEMGGLVIVTFIPAHTSYQVFLATLGTQQEPVSALVFWLAMMTL